MNRSLIVVSLFVLSVVIGTTTLRVRAQGPGFNTPEAQAARQKQLALEAATPKLQTSRLTSSSVLSG